LSSFIGNTKENGNKELESMKAYKYLGIEESHDIKHKNERRELKNEYGRRLRLILIKCKEFELSHY
jgi:hypothetical protein